MVGSDAAALTDGVLHPHATLAAQYTSVRVVPNYFGIVLADMCALCYRSGCSLHAPD